MALPLTIPGKETYADRNSANEAARHKLQTPAVINPQITDVGPPLGRASDRLADNAVHEFKMAKASPSIESMEKFLCSSCLWPIEARATASSAMLDLRRESFLPILFFGHFLVIRRMQAEYCDEMYVSLHLSTGKADHEGSPKAQVSKIRHSTPNGWRGELSLYLRLTGMSMRIH